MRVYYKIDGNDIFSEEYKAAAALNDVAAITLMYMLEYAKYKIMWSLRELEGSMDAEEGYILIDCPHLGAPIKINGVGFSNEVAEKIANIGRQTKL